MKRFRPRLRTILWLVPLIVLLAFCVASYFSSTTVIVGWQRPGYVPAPQFRGVLFVHGAVVVFSGWRDARSKAPVAAFGEQALQGDRWVHLAHYGEPQWRKAGRVAPTLGITIAGRDAGVGWGLSIPSAYVASGAVALAFAIRLLFRAVRHALHRKCAQLGLCQVCGYDLRGTPDRCPECGWIAVRETTTIATPPPRGP